MQRKAVYPFALLVVVAVVVSAAVALPAQQGDDRNDRNDRAKAFALEQKGMNAEAEQVWANLSKVEPRNAEVWAHLGLMESRQERYQEAIGFYNQALAIAPELPGLRMNLGLALFKAGQFPAAMQSFTAEIRKHPGDQRLTILLGMAHYGMGDYLVAIPYLQQAATHDPQNLPLRITLAHSCLWSKQYQCVLDVYQQILALNAESAEADMLAGEALDEKGDNAGATRQFRAAVAANPKAPNVHFALGYLLWTQNQFPEAAKEFELELQNDPAHAQARVYLADCWVQQDEFTKALPELEKVASLDNSQSLVHRDLGIVYEQAGRKEEAARELKKAIELDPTDVAPHWRIARLYRSMGRNEEAKAEFDRAGKMLQQNRAPLAEKLDTPPPAKP